MAAAGAAPASIDEYIAAAPANVRGLLEKIRGTVRAAAPEAQELISYRMPAFRQGGILIYFAAFQKHVGVYPPVQGDDALARDLAPYAGEKGNLKFPLDQPFPFDLIERIVKLRLEQNLAKSGVKRPRKR